MDVYERYGVKKVVNAAFHLTRLGGSRLSPKVLEAMAEANEAQGWNPTPSQVREPATTP